MGLKPPNPDLLKLLLPLLLLAACNDDSAGVGQPAKGHSWRPTLTIQGAGATFPAPVLSSWSQAYYAKTGLNVQYKQLGSRGGVDAVKAGSVDFGATDVPLSPAQLKQHGLVQFPIIIGGVVPVVNLPGVVPGALRLTGTLLSRIYRGKITRWDDPAIKAANPRLALPARQIIPIHQQGASGTSELFRAFIARSAVRGQQAWGAGGQVKWTVSVGARGNRQMARFVKQFKYTLGYVSISLANQRSLTWTRLLNRDGNYAMPIHAACQAAADHGSWDGDLLQVSLIHAGGKQSWPMVGASYILMRATQQDPRTAVAALRFFRWGLTRGAASARALHFVVIPAARVEQIERHWAAHIRAVNRPLWQRPPAAPRPASQPASSPAEPASRPGP